MCGRFVLHTPRSRIAESFGEPYPVGDVIANYNVAPGTQITVVVAEPPKIRLNFALWGFKPSWADDKAPTPINARAEGVATSRYFREAFEHRRGLVPANGYYEWLQTPQGKQPYYISREDGELLYFAAIWTPTGVGTDTRCAILTEPAAPGIAHIHDRMPVMLDQDSLQPWLDPDRRDRDSIRSAARRSDPDKLIAYPVSTAVNSPANNTADLIAPLE